MVDIQSAENRRGKRRKKETTAANAKYNGLPYWAAINIPPHFTRIVKLPYDLSLVTIHVSDCCQFSDVDVVRVVTGEIFNDQFVTNLLHSLPVKDF